MQRLSVDGRRGQLVVISAPRVATGANTNAAPLGLKGIVGHRDTRAWRWVALAQTWLTLSAWNFRVARFGMAVALGGGVHVIPIPLRTLPLLDRVSTRACRATADDSIRLQTPRVAWLGCRVGRRANSSWNPPSLANTESSWLAVPFWCNIQTRTAPKSMSGQTRLVTVSIAFAEPI